MLDECLTLNQQRDLHEKSRREWFVKNKDAIYQHFQIRDDERAFCVEPKCDKLVLRTFGGRCYDCHVEFYGRLGQKPCPVFPVGM